MLLSFLALVYVSLAWGSAFILIKFVEETIAPLTVQAGRCTVGFLALLILSIVLRRDIIGHAMYWFAFLVFSILGISFLWIVTALGEEYVAVGLTSVLLTVTPLVTFIITVFILRIEKFTVAGFLGLFVGVLGLVLAVGINNVLGCLVPRLGEIASIATLIRNDEI